VLEGPVTGQVTVFVVRFDDFIYEAFTGEKQDGLRVLRYVQDDARFSGFEAVAEVELLHRARHHLAVRVWGDYVRAELLGSGEPLPRIPPLRVGTGLRYEGGPFRAEVGAYRVSEQDRVAAFEEPTPGYTMLDASVGYRLFTGRFMHEVTLRGANLADRDARSHTSFLKDVAPLPGRDVKLVYRLSF
jgi:iron complex outermembrane receptor protein